MSTILALQCLEVILEAYTNIHFQFINICVDSQGVLNWILKGQTKVKSKFVNNKVKECKRLLNIMNILKYHSNLIM